MEKELVQNRAWIEIDLNNLEHNIKEIKKIISTDTKIMAVVKANAYGHGMAIIAKKLEMMGITDFAVATLEEAIILRENEIMGNILILGYTNTQNMKAIIKYDLIQTVVDEEYAKELLMLPFGSNIKVHLKINTGMNRIGIDYRNINFIKYLYKSSLNILGIYSHLCVSDSSKEDDIVFTDLQIERFNNLISELKRSNINPGKIHLQSSYGILNYNSLKFDYVRVGIIMYGVHSEDKMNTKIRLDLRPVLSVKARITSVKEILVNETVGYGRTYRSSKREKIASVAIGYADGYPRNLSGKEVLVLVRGKPAIVIGRICMDQLIIKVTGIEVKTGDVVTLIGAEKEVRAEKVAASSFTITNELLSRLGDRLKRVYKGC